MSLASLFSVPHLHRTSAPIKARRRQLYRQPIHSRPCLEHLEERTLLDASSGLIGGNNLAFNGAPASSGIILPMQNVSGVTALGFPIAGVAAALPATASFAAQSIAGTLGFGSGTDPNAPWQPNAYNVGLANHQYSYPSQTDVGFTAVPPWHRP